MMLHAAPHVLSCDGVPAINGCRNGLHVAAVSVYVVHTAPVVFWNPPVQHCVVLLFGSPAKRVAPVAQAWHVPSK